MSAACAYVQPMHGFRKLAHVAALGVAAFGLMGAGWQATADAAGNVPVVVELFTSQGCSSCPPADAALADLAGRDDVIALSLHVKYWDYLGWRDTFGQRQFGQRQAAYRDAWGKRVVYTPQIVVHGAQDVRARADELESAIAKAQRPEPPISVSIKRMDGMLKCRIVPGPEPVVGTVWIAKYTLSTPVEITRGENAGRTFTYTNVVKSLSRIGVWSGTDAEDVAMPQPEPGEGVAIWVQDGEAGPILAAAKVDLPLSE